jgi:hypothetical protein
MLPTSPYSKTTMQPLGTFTKKGSHVGLLLPTGEVIVNFSDNTHQSVLVQIADALGAELISISGTWTWEPDSEQAFKIIARRKS